MKSKELITILEQAFDGSSKINNSAIKKVYAFSRRISNLSEKEKIIEILPFLESSHIYPKYWGAVIALSYKVLEERAIMELIYIIDINPQEYNKPLDLNLLKIDVGSVLYHYKKFGRIGSFPGHNETQEVVLPNYKRVVEYYKRKYRT